MAAQLHHDQDPRAELWDDVEALVTNRVNLSAADKDARMAELLLRLEHDQTLAAAELTEEQTNALAELHRQGEAAAEERHRQGEAAADDRTTQLHVQLEVIRNLVEANTARTAKALRVLVPEIRHDELTLLDCIGHGQDADVHRGEYAGQRVAIKVLRGRLSDQEIKRLRKEGSVLHQLHHVNIVQLLGISVDDRNKCCIVMELAKESLADLLERRQDEPFELAEVLAMLQDMLRGLVHMHRLKVYHRDLKSLNVLVFPGGVLKLADLGAAKADEVASQKSAGGQRGTYPWMAPELLDLDEDEKLDNNGWAKVDIFALMIILWQLLTRQVPWEGKSIPQIIKAVMKGKRPELPPPTTPATLEQHTEAALRRLLEDNWGQDPGSRAAASEILRDVDRMLGELGGDPRPRRQHDEAEEPRQQAAAAAAQAQQEAAVKAAEEQARLKAELDAAKDRAAAAEAKAAQAEKQRQAAKAAEEQARQQAAAAAKAQRAAEAKAAEEQASQRAQLYRKDLDEQIVNAAEKGDTAKIRSLLAQGADPNGTKYRDDTYTALYIAANWGCNDAVTVLLDAGATINAKSKDRHFTPVMAAALGNKPSTVQLLCTRGADTTIKDNQGRTALALAKQCGRSEIAAFLQQKPH